MSCNRVALAVVAVLVVAFLLSACQDDAPSDAGVGTGGETATETGIGAPTETGAVDETHGEGQRHPDVVGATAVASGDGTWDFDVTVSSPYDTPDRYADAWRIVGPDGTVYGVRELAHDHANEQPFTRSLGAVEIPAGVDRVSVEARDLVNGWGGGTVEVVLSEG